MNRKNKIWIVTSFIIIVNLLSISIISADSVNTSGQVVGDVLFQVGNLLDFGTVTIGETSGTAVGFITAGTDTGMMIVDTLDATGTGWNVQGVMPASFVRGTFDSIPISSVRAGDIIAGNNFDEIGGDASAVAAGVAGIPNYSAGFFAQAGTTTLSSAITLMAADTTTARFGSYYVSQSYAMIVPAFTTPGTYTGTYTLTLTAI